MEMINYRFVWMIILIILVVGGSYFIVKQKVKLEEVCFEDSCFQVEIAVKQIDKINGLMYREKLDEDKGMLFVFEKEGNYSFWMKNMNFSIDIIWINNSFDVIDFVESVPPCYEEPCESYFSESPANYVLEVNSGKISEIGLEKGDKITLSYQ